MVRRSRGDRKRAFPEGGEIDAGRADAGHAAPLAPVWTGRPRVPGRCDMVCSSSAAAIFSAGSPSSAWGTVMAVMGRMLGAVPENRLRIGPLVYADVDEERALRAVRHRADLGAGRA